MGVRFQELDRRETPMGELVLRRRRTPWSDDDVYEVKLGDEFLMSSLFTVAEQEMARLALAEVDGDAVDVVVGGLGLGYTARAALDVGPRVASVRVVEVLEEVIEWHRDGLVPLGGELASDPRCSLQHGDFFDLLAGGRLDPWRTGRRFDAVLLDIDHSPGHTLRAEHEGFYTADGLRALLRQLRPGGVFAMWSNDPPEPGFQDLLAHVFPVTRAEVVNFHNPIQDRRASATVYLGVAPRAEEAG
jgi:spermidine synthase